MRGAVCERIVLERGSIPSVRAGGGPAVLPSSAGRYSP
jgi:hypothetical protein